VPAAALLIAGFVPAPSAQQRDTAPPPAKAGTAVVAGTLMSDETAARPVRRARVTLNSFDKSVTLMASTDDSGRFAFVNVPGGRYLVQATKPAWLAANYGAKRPPAPRHPDCARGRATAPPASAPALTDIHPWRPPWRAPPGGDSCQPAENTLARAASLAGTRRAHAGISPHANLADHRHRVLPPVGCRLPAVCFGERNRREYLEARQRSRHGVVEWPGSTNLWRPGDRTRWAKHCVFRVQQGGKTLLYVMHADGSNARMVTDSLDLQGAPAWAPDGQSITLAAGDHGVPHLFRVPMDGRSPASFVREYSVDPAWAPTAASSSTRTRHRDHLFREAVTAEAAPHSLPTLTLTRGARHLAFPPGGRTLMLLRGGHSAQRPVADRSCDG